VAKKGTLRFSRSYSSFEDEDVEAEEIYRGKSNLPFLIDDGSGYCLVDLRGAKALDRRVGDAEVLTRHFKSGEILARNKKNGKEEEHGYCKYTLLPGDRITFVPHLLSNIDPGRRYLRYSRFYLFTFLGALGGILLILVRFFFFRVPFSRMFHRGSAGSEQIWRIDLAWLRFVEKNIS
jgi:hypothetical protein